MEQLKQLYAERRATGGSQKNLAVNIQCDVMWCELKPGSCDIFRSTEIE